MRHVSAHRLIAYTAEQFAQAIYEECAKDNGWYAVNRGAPRRREIIRSLAPEMVPHVKEHFCDMLQNPSVPERDKALIFEALSLQAQLPQGGTSYVL